MGRNECTDDRELRQGGRAICKAINEASEAVADEIYEQLAKALAARLTLPDRGMDRLLLAF